MFEQIKLALRLKKAADEIEKEIKMGFSWKIALQKGGIEFLKNALSVSLMAVVAFYLQPDAVTNLLEKAGTSSVLIGILSPLIHSGLETAQNYLKHAGDESNG